MNITPAHYLLHQSSIEITHDTQSEQDCNYFKLVINGQGSFLNSDTYIWTENIENDVLSFDLIFADAVKIKNQHYTHPTLRAPPTA